MTGWTEGAVKANGININYQRTGGNKPAMLLLHGITDNGLCWTRVALEFQGRYDIVMLDARGHGKSDRLTGEFSVPQLAADAADVIRGLRLARPIVFGHSMGAITAAALAADYPDLVGAVILEDPPLRDAAAPPPAEFIQALRAEFGKFKTMSPQQRSAGGAAQNPNWHRLETDAWAESKAEVDDAVFEQVGSFDHYSWRDAFKRMRCPGLLLIGDLAKMAIVSPEVAAEAVGLWQAGEVVSIAGAGHCIHRDQYEATLAAIRAFLDKQGL